MNRQARRGEKVKDNDNHHVKYVHVISYKHGGPGPILLFGQLQANTDVEHDIQNGMGVLLCISILSSTGYRPILFFQQSTILDVCYFVHSHCPLSVYAPVCSLCACVTQL